MNGKRESSPWQEHAAKVFLILSGLAAAYLLFSHVLWLILPFLSAFLLAAVIRPGAAFLERKWKLPRRVGAVLLLVLLLAVLGILITLGCRQLILEMQKLTDHIKNGELPNIHLEEVFEVLTGLTEHIPLLSHLKSRESSEAIWAQIDAKLAEIIADTLQRWSAKIPNLIATLLRGIPEAIIFLLTFFLAAFYCCADGDKISVTLISFLPESLRCRIPEGRARLARLGGRYLRAYFMLFLMTFVELLIGFTVLRFPYTFLPAMLIALVDILPVLGVGTVLVPWGCIELLRGHIASGTGLLILCGIMMLLRQIIEPHIIGDSLGLHPLATLFAAYVGFALFGLFGMLLGPAVALIVKGLLKQRTD